MKKLGKVLIILLSVWGSCALAAVTASVDRARIAESDSFQLTVRGTAGEPVSETDLDPLREDFDVVSTSTASKLSVVNGRTERSADLIVVLLPRRTGDLVIPPLSVGNQRTREIIIDVTDAPADLDGSRDVFVEAVVDHSSVYVQSQIIHTFRVYEAIDLVDRGRSQLEIPDAVIEELDSAQFQRVIDGRPYRVIEVRHAIFPQKSGKLTIPAMSFNGSRLLPRRSFFDRNVETLRRRSEAITVDVKPIPAAWPDAPWVPAADLKLEESWSTLPEQLEVGDSVTRTVTMIAEGIDGSQLPPLAQVEVPGLKAYPDQPGAENRRGVKGITGIGTNSTALLLTEPGSFELPPIRVPWWDTRQDRLRYAEIPGRTLNIKPVAGPGTGAAMSANTAPPQRVVQPTVNPSPAGIWMWTTVAALMGWLITTGWLLWRMQPRRASEEPSGDPGEAPLFRQLVKACEQNRAAEARAALQCWGQRYFDDTAPPTLMELRQRFASEDLERELAALERSLYGQSALEWTGAGLATAIGQWRKNDTRRRKSSPPPLPPLYRAGGGTSGTAEAGV